MTGRFLFQRQRLAGLLAAVLCLLTAACGKAPGSVEGSDGSAVPTTALAGRVDRHNWLEKPVTPFTIAEPDVMADAEETIYEDALYMYELPAWTSRTTVLTWADGTQLSLREALGTEKASIAEALDSGIHVYMYPKAGSLNAVFSVCGKSNRFIVQKGEDEIAVYPPHDFMCQSGELYYFQIEALSELLDSLGVSPGQALSGGLPGEGEEIAGKHFADQAALREAGVEATVTPENGVVTIRIRAI